MLIIKCPDLGGQLWFLILHAIVSILSDQTVKIYILVWNSDNIDVVLVKRDVDLESDELNSELGSAADFCVTLERELNISKLNKVLSMKWYICLDDLQNLMLF